MLASIAAFLTGVLPFSTMDAFSPVVIVAIAGSLAIRVLFVARDLPIDFLNGIVVFFFMLLALGEFERPCLSTAEFVRLTEHPEWFFQRAEEEPSPPNDTSTAQFFAFAFLCTGAILLRHRAWQKKVLSKNPKVREAFRYHCERYAQLLIITLLWQWYLFSTCQAYVSPFPFWMRSALMRTNLLFLVLIIGSGAAMTSNYTYEALEEHNNLRLSDWWGIGAETNLYITEVGTFAFIWPLQVDTTLSQAFILVKPLAVFNLVILNCFVRKARGKLLQSAPTDPDQQSIRNLLSIVIFLLMLLTLSALWLSDKIEAPLLLSLMLCATICGLALGLPILYRLAR